jgi:hypothetical protein
VNVIKRQVQNITNKLLSRGALYVFILTSIFWILCSLGMGNFYRPLVGDEGDYIGRGIAIINNGLLTIADGYRPPLFPM